MTESKQRAERYRVRGMSVVYDTGEAYWSGPVVDASTSGLFIETTHELPIGTEVTLLPDTPDEDDRLPFEVRAKVVRVNEYDLDNHFDRVPGIALQLVGLDDAQVGEFHAFLEEHGVRVRGT